jgi:hypothetical protein
MWSTPINPLKASKNFHKFTAKHCRNTHYSLNSCQGCAVFSRKILILTLLNREQEIECVAEHLFIALKLLSTAKT